MKLYRFSILIFLISCINAKQKHEPSSYIEIDSTSENENEYLFQMHQEIDTIILSDVNNDHKQDTAIILSPYYALDSPDGKSIGGCQDDSCLTQVYFNFTIAVLSHASALGFQTFFSAGDLNSDGIAEFAFIPNWFQSCWQNLFVYSLNNNSWKLIGTCNVWACSDEDFSKRIKKINNRTFEISFDIADDDSPDGIRKNTITFIID